MRARPILLNCSFFKFHSKKKLASKKGILTKLEPIQVSGFSQNLQNSDLSLENWCYLACGCAFLKCKAHLFLNFNTVFQS